MIEAPAEAAFTHTLWYSQTFFYQLGSHSMAITTELDRLTF